MTDNITLPRATVQQALEALEWSTPFQDATVTHSDAITALRAAMGQQAEPIGWLDGNDKLAEFMHRDLKAEHDKRGSATPREFTVPVYTAPLQQQAEPVAAAPALIEALDHIAKTIERQIELIKDRAPGVYLDKRPVVKSLQSHAKRARDAIAKAIGTAT